MFRRWSKASLPMPLFNKTPTSGSRAPKLYSEHLALSCLDPVWQHPAVSETQTPLDQNGQKPAPYQTIQIISDTVARKKISPNVPRNNPKNLNSIQEYP